MPLSPIKLAVLLYGGGTTLQNLLDTIAAEQLDAQVQVVISSRPGVKGLERAANAKVMNFVVERAANPDLVEFSKQVFQLIDDSEADLVVLAGWMSLVKIPAKYI